MLLRVPADALGKKSGKLLQPSTAQEEASAQMAGNGFNTTRRLFEA